MKGRSWRLTALIAIVTSSIATSVFPATAVSQIADHGPNDFELFTGEIAEIDLESLLGEVTTPSGKPESIASAPAAVTVISARELRLSGARDLPDLLRFVPGLQAYQSAPGAFSVAARGMGGLQDNNLLVLLDGQPMARIIDSSTTWAMLPVDLGEIHHIEIVRGAVSALYGANAYTGVVNIVTKGSETSEARFILATGLDDKLHPGHELSLRIGDGKPNASAWTLSGRLRRSGVYGEMSTPAHDNVDHTLNIATARFQFSKKLDSKRRIAANGWTAFQSRVPHNHLHLDPDQHRTTGFGGNIEYHCRAAHGAVDGVKAWARTRGYIERPTKDDPKEKEKDSSDAVSLELGVEGRLDFAGGAGVVDGGEVRVGLNMRPEYVRAAFVRPIFDNDLSGNLAVYVLGERRLSPVVMLSGGLRFDHGPRQGERASYRLSLSAQPWSTLAARATLARAFRVPTFIETNGRFVDQQLGIIVLDGDSNLSPQQVTSAEIGTIWAPTQNVVLEPTLYALHLDSIISEDFAPVARKSFRNLDTSGGLHADIVGAEFGAKIVAHPHATIRAAFAGLYWPDGGAQQEATIGVERNNPTITGSLRVFGEIDVGRCNCGTFGYGLGIQAQTGRKF